MEDQHGIHVDGAWPRETPIQRSDHVADEGAALVAVGAKSILKAAGAVCTESSGCDDNERTKDVCSVSSTRVKTGNRITSALLGAWARHSIAATTNVDSALGLGLGRGRPPASRCLSSLKCCTISVPQATLTPVLRRAIVAVVK